MTAELIIPILALAGFAAVIKSTCGFGYPLLMVPTLAQFIDVVDAVLIIGPSNLFLNLGMVWKLRDHHRDAKTLPMVAGTGTIGAIGGTLVLPFIPIGVFRLIMFLVLVAFLFNRLSSYTLVISDQRANRLAPVLGSIAGVFQGAAGVSGPIVTPWFLSIEIERDTFIYALSAFFAITQIGQLIIGAVGQLYTTETLVIGMLMVPLSLISIPIGGWLRNRISVAGFERMVIVLLAISATSLLLRLL